MVATSQAAFVTLLLALGGWWLPSNRRAITLTQQQAPAQLSSTQCTVGDEGVIGELSSDFLYLSVFAFITLY